MNRAERLAANARALALVADAEAGEDLSRAERRAINEAYTGLGGLVETEHQGLAGLTQAREEGFAQFFTPPEVGVLAAEMLAIPDGATVFDPAIGTGRMLFDLQDRVRITGIEVEADAFRACRVSLPTAAVVQDDLIDHMVEDTFDYVIGNPPFSLTLTDRRRRYVNTNWEGRVLSHLAWIELAVRAVRPGGFVAAVLPRDVFAPADTISFHRWLNRHAWEVGRVGLPEGTFLGTDWPCVLAFFQKVPDERSRLRFAHPLVSLTDTHDVMRRWQRFLRDHATVDVIGYARTVEPRATPIELPPSEVVLRPRPRPPGELPLLAHDEVRLLPGERLGLKANGLVAALALEELRLASPTHYDRKRDVHINEWDELRRRPFLLHEKELLGRLAGAGLSLWMDEADRRGLDRRRRWLDRQNTPIERDVLVGDEWKTLFADDGTMARHVNVFLGWLRRAHELGLDRQLSAFQLIDVCQIAMKSSVLLAPQQGLGKTREAICAQILLDIRRGLYVVPSKLIGEWENEFRVLELPVQVIDSYTASQDLGRFNLVAYEALWRAPRGSPSSDGSREDGDATSERTRLRHTLAARLRRRFAYIVLDEAYYIKNPKALRSRAVFHLRARRRIPMTGTPIKGYPQNILALLNWAFGSGSSRLPDYSYHEEGGVKRFLDAFGTYVYYDRQHEETGDKGKKKQIPKINNIDRFFELLRAKMIRRVKREPAVRAVIRTRDPEIRYVPLAIEGDHRRFYDAWLREFKRWFEQRLREESLDGKRLGKMEILAKLGYLIQAATIPQSANLCGASAVIKPYRGGPTTLQAWALQTVRERVSGGEKVILFSRYLESLAYLGDQLRDLSPITVTGSVSLERSKKTGKSERQELVEAFRQGPMPVLLAGTTCLAEGFNIPEASIGVFTDYDWTPSVHFQGIYRMVRPQQRRQVTAFFPTLMGTIMEYMQMLCELKQRAIDEGIDHQEHELDVEDLPDIEQYCRAIVEDGGHVPPKRTMHIGGMEGAGAEGGSR